MAFDPFGDHAEKGYLRNMAGVSDPEMVKRLEHRSVISNLKEALGDLQTGKPLTYQDVLKTHETLFKDVYPWAGKDRFAVGREEAALTGDPSKRDLGGMITKGPVSFMPSNLHPSISSCRTSLTSRTGCIFIGQFLHISASRF